MPQLDVAGLPIHYESRGEGFPVVLIHGFTPDHRLMTGCFEPLFERRSGWQRIYLDLPGMGRTPGSDAIQSSDDMLDVVLAFVDRVAAGRRVAVVGQSYGGYLARGLALRRADALAGIALLCPVSIAEIRRRTLPPRTVLATDDALLEALVASQPAPDVDEFRSMAVVQTPATWERFQSEILPGLHAADDAFLARIAGRYAFSFDVDALARPFERPSLFLFGRQDHVVGYEDAWPILRAYPRATFAVLDRAGHNLQLEQEPLFEALVDEWLARVEEEFGR